MKQCRPYQSEAVEETERILREHSSALIVMPTGCGKTVTFAELARRAPGKVLVLAHRKELITQTKNAIAWWTGENVSVERGEERMGDGEAAAARIVCASVQTMIRPGRRSKVSPRDLSMIVIDEAHRAVANSYRNAVGWYRERNPAVKLVGVTATPKRADEAALGAVFDQVAFEMDIDQARDEGWLVPIRQKVFEIRAMKLDAIKTRRKDGEEDFDPVGLAKILEEDKVLYEMSGPVADNMGDSPGIFFSGSVEQAKRMAEILNAAKPGCADWVCGDVSRQPRQMRDAVITAYKEGRLQVLCNCDVTTEGFDAPHTRWVALGSPTKSRVRFAQRVGRVTRTLPSDLPDQYATEEERCEAIAASAKTCGLVLDLRGDSGRHRVCGLEDILGGKDPEVVLDRAHAISTQTEGGGDAEENLYKARALERFLRLAAEQAAREEVRRKIKAEVQYDSREVDIYNGSGSRGRWNGSGRAAPGGDGPSKKQRGYLKYLGYSWEFIDTIKSPKQASAIIDKTLKERGEK